MLAPPNHYLYSREIYNLNLVDAQIVTRYGGSIRCVVSKRKIEKSSNLKSLLELENKILIKEANKTFETFAEKTSGSVPSRRTGINDLSKRNNKFYNKVQKGYIKLAKNKKNYMIVNSNNNE